MKKISILLLIIILVSPFSCSQKKDAFPNYLIVEPKVTSETIERGKYLFEVSACKSCHALGGVGIGALVGGVRKALDESPVAAPYLGGQFAGGESGERQWSLVSFFDFFKQNVYPSGRAVVEGVHEGYEWISDDDLISLSSYLANLPKVQEEIIVEDSHDFQESSYLPNFSSKREVYGYVPQISSKFKEAYGKYLADSVLRCNVCHAARKRLFHTEEYLEGGRYLSVEDEELEVPALGKQDSEDEDSENKAKNFVYWSELEMQAFLETGFSPSGRKINSDYCPTNYFAHLSEDDQRAIIKFYKSLVSK